MIKINTEVQDLLTKLAVYSPTTYIHSKNVSNLAVSFGQYLGLSENDIEKLRIAGLLHDIGKLNIPTNILHKPSKLTEEEYETIKKHPKEGVTLLVKTRLLNPEILTMIFYHHERIDGLGYPNGLKGNSIPDLVKILTICDCYEAMSAHRIYKMNEEIDIKNEFESNSGTQFDSNYTQLFLNFLKENNYTDSKNDSKELK